ncbi:tripartite tricarboxylate transporter family receptor [Variibacter gotjawalensis]|uniref:Tripartite tricarboxylate transporter family receptor n=1 Tax=Variibacter gotjawalensis TaxID=1333996 RepID=A0A0S3PVK1_9BRAD|nr:tripartite tricarboxylate transporter substrate binding protein [Variibacter gotjawalensis]NIK45691.1 tripartite-type tricarboxylate transporter receptor subunit TctC [Variibacter gotjawalensis]RZS47618.1 tripartite-type tricarboxylate transporter receptor subunit TctC [Variibacter gotjawalensis]BAT59870.1 tripartite tricarboxylate transporter family receptor [Variibacter gotjawalensis]
MITRRGVVAGAVGSLLVPAATSRLSAQQNWPSRYVRLVVPFPPGGGTDAVGRILATRLSEMWGQQVVIENRGGAGSNIGTEVVARSEPDGYTILFSSIGFAINRFIYPTIPFDPVADFAPITLIATFPNVLAVPNSSSAKSVADVVALAKASPGKLTYATSGIGSSPHLTSELFCRTAGITMTHVPYRGAGPALTDFIAGRIDMMFNTAGAMLPQIRTGQMRGLAVSGRERLPSAPELPTVAEALPGFDVSAWYALFAPAATPRPIVERLSTDAMAVLREPFVRQRLEELGLVVVGSSGRGLAEHLRAEMDRWGPVIRDAKISVQ